MKKCILCDRYITDDSPFTNYCSTTCERKGVGYGEKKGIKKSAGCFGIIILVVGISFFGINKYSSEEKQISNENQVIRIDNQNATNQTKEEKNISDEIIIREKETVLKNTITKEDLSKPNSEEKKESKDSAEIDKAILMLKQGKSIREIAKSTSLTRKEIRKLRRKFRDE